MNIDINIEPHTNSTSGATLPPPPPLLIGSTATTARIDTDNPHSSGILHNPPPPPVSWSCLPVLYSRISVTIVLKNPRPPLFCSIFTNIQNTAILCILIKWPLLVLQEITTPARNWKKFSLHLVSTRLEIPSTNSYSWGSWLDCLCSWVVVLLFPWLAGFHRMFDLK